MFAKTCLSIFFWSFYSLSYAEQALSWEEVCQSNRCEAIVDVGSSGSRLYIYAKNSGQNVWQVAFSKKITPGLSSVSVDHVDEYLNQLIQMKPSKPMPISVYGTAGMRLLPQLQQQLRYQAVTTWFEQHSEWILKQARTITGQEEGVYAWFAVQEELGALGKPLKDLNAVIEIGGASAQVSIPISPREARRLPAQDVYPVRWGNQVTFVWSHSYLGLGINEVEKQFSDVTQCFSLGYPLKNGSVGQGDILNCIQSLEGNPELSLISRLDEAKKIVGKHINMPWIALGAIRFSAQNPPYRFDGQLFNLKQLKEQGDSALCHQDWQSLLQSFGQDPYLYRGCFSASYFYSSLSNGIGINENQMIHYPTPNAQMDWTLGALLLS